MTWWELAWAVGVLIAVTAIVGGGTAWSVGLRGLWIAAAAPAFTLTIVAGSAVVAPWVGLRWSVLPVAIVAVLISGTAIVVRRATRRRNRPDDLQPPSTPRGDWWLVFGILLAAILLAVQFLRVIGAPDAFSQTFDNIFHLNAVRFVLDSGNASSLYVGRMTSPAGGLPFYPAAWHALSAIVIQLTGVGIAVSSNAVTLVASALSWPLGIILLVRALFGRSRAATVAAGVLAASIPAFPVLLYDYGVLYPFLLGLSVLPLALAVVLQVLKTCPPVGPVGFGWWLLILSGAVTGMTLAHPGAFVAFLALTAPMVIEATVRRVRKTSGGARAIAVGSFGLYLVAGAALVRMLRPPAEARGWPTSMSMPDAADTILGASMWYQQPSIVAAVAMVAGIVWAIVDRRRTALVALGMYLIAAWLFFVVAAMPSPTIRDAFTGSWYNNLPRLAAILAIAMVPIGAFGVARTVHALAGWRGVAQLPTRAPRVVAAFSAAIVLAIAIAAQFGPPRVAVDWASPLYRLTPESPLLTGDELALIERLDRHVPPGVAIAGDPYTGAALAYAFGNRPVLMTHTLVEADSDVADIADGLADADMDPSVCRAIEDRRVGFVLDFGRAGVHGPSDRFAGLHELAESGAVALVDDEGDARLYAVTACSANRVSPVDRMGR